ncbi:hypothetical protein [Rhodopila sp.]|uniref:hypothetical protein n=1 Tax=Rhodopila sp. TaxID=2480087 RepID=UPI003D0DF23E
MLYPFRRIFNNSRVTIGDIFGNVIIGNVGGNVSQNAMLEPEIQILDPPWRDVSSRPEASPFNLLSWRSRLASRLIGREADIANLLAWARDDPRLIAIRVLTGPGGSGKTRLAAEVADQLLRTGWRAGIANLDKSTRLPIAAQGLFLIVDYPEAAREMVTALLRGIGRLEKPPSRIRVVLVSRRGRGWWQDNFIAAQVSEFLDTFETTVGPLRPLQTCTLVRDVVGRLAELIGVALPTLDDLVISEWHGQNPEIHGLPLFGTAAALHAVVDEASTFTLAGTEIVEALVARERMRLDTAALGAGWPEAKAASRLHGLAALRAGLDERALKHLARIAPDIGLPTPERIVDKVDSLGWWYDGQVLAPQPDLLAAELLHQTVKERPQAAPAWIAATLFERKAVEVDRLGRLSHDIATLHGESAQSLAAWMNEAVTGAPELATVWDYLLKSSSTTFRLAPVAIEIGHIRLSASSIDDTERAEILHHLSIRKYDVGDAVGALAANQKAVCILRRLASTHPHPFEPLLALSLSNLSNRLSESKDNTAALDASEQAVEIYRRLAADDPVKFYPNLALLLVNLAIPMTAARSAADGLRAIREAVTILEFLATAKAFDFEPLLASALSTLAIVSSVGQDSAAAVKAIQRSVETLRRRSATDPARFEGDLAYSLDILALLVAKCDNASAVDAAHQAVEINRRLAAANPARFELQLQQSLNTLSYCQRTSGI